MIDSIWFCYNLQSNSFIRGASREKNKNREIFPAIPRRFGSANVLYHDAKIGGGQTGVWGNPGEKP